MHLNFLVEVDVKFGAMLGVLRNEARKNPINLSSGSVLIGSFDAQKKEKKRIIRNFEVICTLLHPPFVQLDFTSIAIDLPIANFNNEHLLHGFFLEEYPM